MAVDWTLPASFESACLPFTGTILQPHFAMLSAGLHQFRIWQVTGSFFFLSLTVYRF